MLVTVSGCAMQQAFLVCQKEYISHLERLLQHRKVATSIVLRHSTTFGHRCLPHNLVKVLLICALVNEALEDTS